MNRPRIPLILSVISGLILTGAAILHAYPAAKLIVLPDEITFSHQMHVTEMEVDCQSCHTNITSSQQASDDNLPTMDECSTCHDIEDDEQCGTCHKNPDEPAGYEAPERPILFSHANHIGRDIECVTCHDRIPLAEHSNAANLPTMATCMDCHNGHKAPNDCSLCHNGRIELADIHPAGWKNTHSDEATVNRDYCTGCHRGDNSCLDCHRGDNLTGRIHDLNFQYTHGIEARGKTIECMRCHESRAFCVACHESGIRMPLQHSTVSWRTEHGRAARIDAENCAACHDKSDPACARSGCHSDFDGVRGTDSRIHDPSSGRFDTHGAWHDDRGYFCFDCHTYTGQPGNGFCGYCHGAKP